VLIAGELTEQVIGLVAIPVIYKAMPIGDRSRADIVVVREVILEIKSVAAILPAHEAQLHTRSGWLDPAIGLVSNSLSSSIRPRKREEH